MIKNLLMNWYTFYMNIRLKFGKNNNRFSLFFVSRKEQNKKNLNLKLKRIRSAEAELKFNVKSNKI